MSVTPPDLPQGRSAQPIVPAPLFRVVGPEWWDRPVGAITDEGETNKEIVVAGRVDREDAERLIASLMSTPGRHKDNIYRLVEPSETP